MIMSKKTEIQHLEISKVNISKTSKYLYYNHPTQKNEKGHVKQVTRSINGIKEPQLKALCDGLNTLLKNFKSYTKNLLTIEQIKSEFNQKEDKEFYNKAFDWIIEEELEDNSDTIIESTINHYIPIPKNTLIIEDDDGDERIEPIKNTVLLNETNNELLQNNIPKNIFNESIEYVIADDKETKEFSAVVEFKGIDDLEDFIINKLTLIINNHHSKEIKADRCFSYIGLEFDDNTLDYIEKCVDEIEKSYLKVYKIKAKDSYKCDRFNNHIYNRLRNENFGLVLTIYNMLSKKVEMFDGITSHKLKENDSLPKLLYFKTEDKEDVFEKLVNLFSFNKYHKSTKNLIKTVRLQGNFFTENTENSCIIKNCKNLANHMENTTFNINLDGLKTKDIGVANLLEKVVVYGHIKDFEFTLTKESTEEVDEAEVNAELLNISENLLELFSRNKIINFLKNTYTNEIIFSRSFKLNEVKTLKPISKNIMTTYSANGLDKIITNYLGDESSIYYFDNSNELTTVLNDIFKTKIKQYFDDITYEYVSPKNITNSISEILLDSFMYSMYTILFNPDKILKLKYNYLMIFDYNNFINHYWTKILSTRDEIKQNLLNRIFDELSNINDYSLYKKCLLNSILNDVDIPSFYIREYCVAFENGITSGFDFYDKPQPNSPKGVDLDEDTKKSYNYTQPNKHQIAIYKGIKPGEIIEKDLESKSKSKSDDKL